MIKLTLDEDMNKITNALQLVVYAHSDMGINEPTTVVRLRHAKFCINYANKALKGLQRIDQIPKDALKDVHDCFKLLNFNWEDFVCNDTKCVQVKSEDLCTRCSNLITALKTLISAIVRSLIIIPKGD